MTDTVGDGEADELVVDSSIADDDIEFYRTLLANTSEGILTIDEDSNIVFANPAIEEILGYSPDELVGSSKMTIIPERHRDDHRAGLEAYLRTGKRHIDWDGVELPAQHRAGHELVVSISLREHEYNGERFFTGIFTDVTERREREQRLQEKNERLESFASVVSHDLRNPLGVASAYVEIAQETDTEAVDELVEVERSLDRMERIIDDLLWLARTGNQVGEQELLDLAAVVEDAWETTETADATLVVDSTGWIRADYDRLMQLLENLFRNAIQHGGEDVTVRVGRIEGGWYVEDSGPGIDADLTEEIFSPGMSTEELGTGLGLYIVKSVAEGHGWEIAVGTSTDGGARFEFTGIDEE
ncbi:two-component system sensor histidine kinase NtrB [Natranaeroarchaeum aerophilus]|uniref:histidine kinase n=1 Tax=Natranaeroarchaeum aerophilus TaxID=2917711 RepID=A0AAE3FTU0_9EURY|nr:PAS domain-containing sensor histidine kinase [Natranaeroarchaeum aerophilus]